MPVLRPKSRPPLGGGSEKKEEQRSFQNTVPRTSREVCERDPSSNGAIRSRLIDDSWPKNFDFSLLILFIVEGCICHQP